jgi:hypothetical protein
MTTKEITVPRWAAERAIALAKYAAANDHWMRPCIEREDLSDPGRCSMEHRSGWEQTDHFTILYHDKLRDIAEVAARDLGLRWSDHWEQCWYGLLEPLKDIFWDEWEEAVNFYQVYERACAARRAKG